MSKQTDLINVTDAITVSGSNVGIGTSSPSQSLTVAHEGHGVSIDYVGSTLPANAGLYTSSTAHTQQAYGDLNIKSRSDYAGYGIGLYTASSNNTPTLRMRIDSAGRVTMPYQPAFDVAANSNGNNSGDIIYPQVWHDQGGNYSTSTGRFTAPVSGRYLFYWTAIKNSQINTVVRLFLKKNGTQQYGNRHLRLDAAQEYGDNGAMIAILNLNANDYVNVYVGAGNIYNQTNEYCIFGGYLIG